MPEIPRLFANKEYGDQNTQLESGDILDAASDGAIFLYKISSYQPRHHGGIGSAEDLAFRTAVYDDLSRWYAELPPKTCYAQHQLGNYHYIRFDCSMTFVHALLTDPILERTITLP